MKILITGGAGFIGYHLAKHLLGRKDKVVILDNFDPYYDVSLKERRIKLLKKEFKFKLYRYDIRDAKKIEQVFKKERPDKIIHMAASAGVRYSIEHPQLFLDVNVAGTLNIFEMARKYKIKNIVFASTSAIYGDSDKLPLSEKDPADFLISPYAVTKRECELWGYYYHKLYNIPITCLRFFTVYGTEGRPDMAIGIFTKAIFEGKPLPMFGDGSTIRDYTYIDDIVSGVVRALDKNYPYEIINIGGSQTTNLKSLISIIEKEVGKPAKIKRLPMQPGDPHKTLADIKKAKKLLNFRPRTDIKAGIRIFVEWYKREIAKK